MAQIAGKLEYHSTVGTVATALLGTPKASKASSQIETLEKAGRALASNDDENVRRLGVLWGEWLAAGGVGLLDTALGLRQRGGPSIRRTIAIGERDDLLRRLWRTSPDWRDLSAGAASRLMHLAAARYEANRWPADQTRLSSPSSEPAATWWKVLRTGAPLPRAKRLEQILQMEIQTPV